jgi:hypothetical protein
MVQGMGHDLEESYLPVVELLKNTSTTRQTQPIAAILTRLTNYESAQLVQGSISHNQENETGPPTSLGGFGSSLAEILQKKRKCSLQVLIYQYS